MSKVLVEIYFTYGKGDGEELVDDFVSEDSKSLREELVEDYGRSALFTNGNKESFIEGEDCSIGFDTDGGDWDDPTGVGIVITTYSEKKDELEERYRSNIKRLNKQFGVEDE